MLILCFVLLLSACQTETSSAHIKETEVIQTLEQYNVHVIEVKSETGIFGSKLNGVKPGAYELNSKPFYIYEFATEQALEKGKQAFADNTANMNIISFQQYEKRNILIFYVHGENLGVATIPFDKEIQQALDSIIEG